MSAVQLETPVEGQFLHITPEKKLRFTGGAWRLHTNNLPVSEHSPVPAIPPIRSEEPPALSVQNPFWQKTSTGELFYKYQDENLVWSWKEIGEDPPAFPLLSEEPPALPNANPFWQKSSTGQLFFQYANGGGDTAWWPVQNQNRYDLTVSVTTSVLDFGTNQVFKVDNTTASVKSLVVQNAPANRSMTVPVIIMGKVGTVNFPAGVNWDQGKVPTLSNTKTTLIFFWDGSTLTGSKGHSY